MLVAIGFADASMELSVEETLGHQLLGLVEVWVSIRVISWVKGVELLISCYIDLGNLWILIIIVLLGGGAEGLVCSQFERAIIIILRAAVEGDCACSTAELVKSLIKIASLQRSIIYIELALLDTIVRLCSESHWLAKSATAADSCG